MDKKLQVDKEFLYRVLDKQDRLEKAIVGLSKKMVAIDPLIQKDRFPVIIKGVMEHQHISEARQKEFFEELRKLMILYKVNVVNVKLKTEL